MDNEKAKISTTFLWPSSMFQVWDALSGSYGPSLYIIKFFAFIQINNSYGYKHVSKDIIKEFHLFKISQSSPQAVTFGRVYYCWLDRRSGWIMLNIAHCRLSGEWYVKSQRQIVCFIFYWKVAGFSIRKKYYAR